MPSWNEFANMDLLAKPVKPTARPTAPPASMTSPQPAAPMITPPPTRHDRTTAGVQVTHNATPGAAPVATPSSYDYSNPTMPWSPSVAAQNIVPGGQFAASPSAPTPPLAPSPIDYLTGQARPKVTLKAGVKPAPPTKADLAGQQRYRAQQSAKATRHTGVRAGHGLERGLANTGSSLLELLDPYNADKYRAYRKRIASSYAPSAIPGGLDTVSEGTGRALPAIAAGSIAPESLPEVAGVTGATYGAGGWHDQLVQDAQKYGFDVNDSNALARFQVEHPQEAREIARRAMKAGVTQGTIMGLVSFIPGAGSIGSKVLGQTGGKVAGALALSGARLAGFGAMPTIATNLVLGEGVSWKEAVQNTVANLPFELFHLGTHGTGLIRSAIADRVAGGTPEALAKVAEQASADPVEVEKTAQTIADSKTPEEATEKLKKRASARKAKAATPMPDKSAPAGEPQPEPVKSSRREPESAASKKKANPKATVAPKADAPQAGFTIRQRGNSGEWEVLSDGKPTPQKFGSKAVAQGMADKLNDATARKATPASETATGDAVRGETPMEGEKPVAEKTTPEKPATPGRAAPKPPAAAPAEPAPTAEKPATKAAPETAAGKTAPAKPVEKMTMAEIAKLTKEAAVKLSDEDLLKAAKRSGGDGKVPKKPTAVQEEAYARLREADMKVPETKEEFWQRIFCG